MDLRPISLLLLLLGGNSLSAQSTCGNQFTAPGAFICSPNPSLDPRDASVPAFFHFSAQGNALSGRKIDFYVISLDKRPIYQSRLAAPAERLSIEVNLRSTLASGIHTLSIAINGAGNAEVDGVQFRALAFAPSCEPVTTVPSTACTPFNFRTSTTWIPATLLHSGTSTNPLLGFAAYLGLYLQNLENLEADTADAVAVDSNGNLYAAWHLLTGLELRKYSHDGSVVYDSVISSCGQGSIAISGIAVDRGGRAWLAGNTSACLVTNSNAWQHRVRDSSEQRGFVMLLDTSSPTRTAPLYTTYLADTENKIAGIQVDAKGNAYLTGTTESNVFPHDFSYTASGSKAAINPKKTSFVAVLNASGSRLQWSALMQNVELTALALDDVPNVYATGSMVGSYAGFGPSSSSRPSQSKVRITTGIPHGGLIVTELSHAGKKMPYSARFSFSGTERALALTATPDGKRVMVIGETDSPRDNVSPLLFQRARLGRRHVVLALQPCTERATLSSLPSASQSVGADFLIGPALDAFSAGLNQVPAFEYRGEPLHQSFQITPACADHGR